ncbi:MAG: squalene--hopene cyclase, partial [Planctomycetes bacterium]|nr:squalene--hopene cyclase [Planctomycetota bacterium]
MIRFRSLLAVLLAVFSLEVSAEEGARVTLDNVEEPPELSPEEPVRGEFSAPLAARYLDTAALHWQKHRKCGTCHTNFAYLMARPSLKSISPPSQEVRKFFESMVEERWESQGPRWDAEVVVTASLLAANDRLTTGKLNPVTRKAFKRMWGLQRKDGGWDWLECGWPPMESDAHYGVTLAALGVGMAPGGYASSDEAKAGVEGIRRYLLKNPPPSLHHRAMLLWAATRLGGLMGKKQQASV